MVLKTAKNFFLNKVIPILLIGLILVLSVPQTAFASSTTDNSSSEADPIGSSLYDITTALSAYASNVIGPNANDKQDDSSANTSNGGNSHIIKMLESTTMGNAGAIVGYTDATQDKTYLMVGNNRGASTANYQAYQYIGDKGHAYEYVRYGRLLSQLGLDEVGNEASPGVRTVAGLVMEGVHLFAQIVPAVFDFSLGVLDFLNPFRFLVNDETTTTALKGVGTGRIKTGTTANPFSANGTNSFEESNTYVYEGISNASSLGGESETNLENELNGQSSTSSETVQGLVTNSVFTGITDITTTIYIQLRAIGMWLVLPLALAFFLAGTFLTRRGRMPGMVGGRIVRFLERFLFILIGVPLLGLMYTALLESIDEKINTDEPTSRVVACTFSNFAGWAEGARLAVPYNDVHLTSEITGDSGPAGVPDADSYRTTRETVYQVNYQLLKDENDQNILNQDSGLGLSGGNSDVTGGTYDDNGLITKQDAGDTAEMFSQLNELISTYQEASFYPPSTWESDIDAIMTGKYISDMGSATSGEDASTNAKTIYQMYHDTDEVSDWMERGPDSNTVIFTGTGGDTSAQWAGQTWNIFSNGSNYGLEDGVDSNQDPIETLSYETGSAVRYTESGGKVQTASSDFWGNAIDPGKKGGLSTVSLYNYLSSVFDENSITVYSAQTTTSEYTKQQHYSVTLAGSGALQVVFAVNAFTVLFIYVFLAFGYAFGMAWHVLKQGFNMLIQIPAAILGVIRSIVQVILLVVGMIIEILVTVLLYEIITEVIFSIASLVEQPIMEFVENIGNNTNDAMSATIAGGLTANTGSVSMLKGLADSTTVVFIGIVIATILVIAIGFASYKLNRVILTAWAYAWQKIYGLLIYDEWKEQYWELMAEENSLYIWDDLAMDIENWADSLKEHQPENDIQAPVVEGGTA